MLPWVFVVFGAGALLLALVAFWFSLRAAFGAIDAGAGPAFSPTEQRASLLDQKATLLRGLKDLELEREMGKISEEDYQGLNATLRRRAREVLRLLDEDLGLYREKAEKLVGEHLGTLGVPSPYRDTHGSSPLERGGGAADDPRASCEKCGTVNDADASFCKKCAAPLGEAPEAAKPDAGDDETSEAGSEAAPEEASRGDAEGES